jgi:hypothetical protein
VTAWEVFSKAETPYSNIQQNHFVIEAVRRGNRNQFLREFFKISIDLGERLKQPEKCPPKIFTTITQCWNLHPKDRPNFEKLVELFKKEKPLF